MRTLLAFLLLGLGASSRAADGASSAPKPPWGRIVMVGASATAGFTASEMLGGTNTPRYRLSRYLDAALLAPHEPVQNLAHALFFMRPEAAGRTQIDEALESKPTLVIGVDFLFWFCYGEMRNDQERQRRFEQGLKLLEPIPCPLILGDIPDASAAVSGGMLTAQQVPSAAARTAANRRLKEWAATHPRVVVVPLAAFMRTVMANEPLIVRGHAWPAGQTRVLIQDDMLHPSPPGAAALALAILDAFQSARPLAATNEIRWNPKEVFRLGSKSPPASNKTVK